MCMSRCRPSRPFTALKKCERGRRANIFEERFSVPRVRGTIMVMTSRFCYSFLKKVAKRDWKTYKHVGFSTPGGTTPPFISPTMEKSWIGFFIVYKSVNYRYLRLNYVILLHRFSFVKLCIKWHDGDKIWTKKDHFCYLFLLPNSIFCYLKSSNYGKKEVKTSSKSSETP
jgi:hypothetical protein